MNTLSIEQAWQRLVKTGVLIGKEVIFDNRVLDCVDKGTIREVVVKDGFVTIESLEIEAAHAAGRTWSPNIKFNIDEGREPQLIGGTIFCDLDDSRQIRISLDQGVGLATK